MRKLLTRVLAHFGYYKITYGFACGRHWMEINGKVVAQTAGDDVYLRDEDVRKLQLVVKGVMPTECG